MNKAIMIVLILLSYCLVNGQNITAVEYYKDVNLYKDATKENAKYKRVFSVLEDGTRKVEVLEIKTGESFNEKYYRNGKPTGIWIEKNKKGEVVSTRDFGKLVYSDVKEKDGLYFEYPQDTKSNQSLNFTPAHFGTREDHIKYLTENIWYPREARESGTQGTVILHVKISKTGDIQVLSVSKSVDPILDIESWRVIESMPAWTPAIKDGEPVDSYTFIPIRYTLAG